MEGPCAIHALCCELAALCGQASLQDVPGCWEHQVDENWLLSLNAHQQKVTDSRGAPVPALCVWAHHLKGIALGVISPVGGFVLGTSEAELLGALEQAIRKLGGTPSTDSEGRMHE